MAEEDWVVIGPAPEGYWNPPAKYRAKPANRKPFSSLRRSGKNERRDIGVVGPTTNSDPSPEVVKAERRRQQEENRRKQKAKDDQFIADILAKADADEVREREQRQAADVRRKMARAGFNPMPNKWLDAYQPRTARQVAKIDTETRQAPPPIRVSEPRTYGEDPSVSWVQDLITVRMQYLRFSPPSRNHTTSPRTAQERLARYEEEIIWDCTRNPDRSELGRIRACISERYRSAHGTQQDYSRRDFLAYLDLNAEARDASTGAGSLGSFVPPVYMVNRFVKARTAAGTFVAQGTEFDLPPTGLSVIFPAVSTVSGISMAIQESENTDIASTSSLEASDIEAPVITIAGSVTTSQQLVDRIGPGLTIDDFVANQAAIQAATVLDTYALGLVLANAATITNSGSPSIAAFFADVARAAAQIVTTEGTALPATHLFVPSLNMKWLQSQLDSEGRPIWGPSPAATLARTGKVGTRSEGYQGYDVIGAQAFENNNLPTTDDGADATLLVGDVPDGLFVGCGELTVDVYPGPLAEQLSVVVNARQYAAVTVTYPNAFVQITGPAYPTAPTFTGS